MISPETPAVGEGRAIGAATAIAGVTSNAAPATVNTIFRIEVSPFQAGTPGDALGDAQAVLSRIYSSLTVRRTKEIFSAAKSYSCIATAASSGRVVRADDARDAARTGRAFAKVRAGVPATQWLASFKPR